MTAANNVKKNVDTEGFIIEENKNVTPKSEKIEVYTSDDIREIVKLELASERVAITGNFISSLGIFASVVAFLLIESQILNNICDINRLIGFSLFLGGILITFSLVLSFITTDQKLDEKKVVFFLLIFIVAIMFIAGYCVLMNSNDELTCHKINYEKELERLKNSIDEETDMKINELEDKLKK